MKAKYFLRVGVTVALGALIGVSAAAKDPKDPDGGSKKKVALFKTAGSPKYAQLSINNLTTWVRHDGLSNFSPSSDNGVYYPRGTGNVIYKDCVVWGGKVYTNSSLTSGPGTNPLGDGSQPVRIGGGTYGIGTRAGTVTGFGASAVAADPNAADVRIYRIRRDYYTMTKADYTQDALPFYEHSSANDVTDSERDALRAQYELDWMNWPVDLGAPYIDRNGNGVYDAVTGGNTPATYFPFNTDPNAGPVFTVDSLIAQGKDEPGVAGGDPNSPADQVIWTVYNDLDQPTAFDFESSNPVGLEIQKTVWGYKRTDALGNLYFNRFRIINKGGIDTSSVAGDQLGSFWVDSMYFCQWSDPDLGSFSDDLVGCDTSLSLGYVYNANGVDVTFRAYNLPPPSAGYDFLAGPTVTSAGDSAVVNLKRVYGKKNLGMSSFAYFSAGSPYSDPPGDYPSGAGRWWKMLRGFAPLGDFNSADEPYAYPAEVGESKFPLSGDPVTGTGWIDGQGEAYSFNTGDRRLLVTTGPFSLAPGDTQEVYVGFVVGIGADRLSSISVMKFNDQFVQNTFDALFQVPSAPKAPNVQVAELDGQVVLEWGSDAASVADIEGGVNNPGDFRFEGYNVYQFPSRGAQLSEATRIATYDLVADPSVILDQKFDVTSGQILSLPVQFGSNSGIVRKFLVDRDYVNDIDKLYNGQEYYFAVTSYAHSKIAGYLPSVLESAVNIQTVQPKVEFGKIVSVKYGDTLTTAHTGPSDGSVTPLVIDPLKLNGHTYNVTFNASNQWKLTDTNTSTDVLSAQTNQSGDEDYTITDGMQVKVQGPPLVGKAWNYTAASPVNISPVAQADHPAYTGNNRWFTGGGHGGELMFGGVFMEPNFWGATTVTGPEYKMVEVRFSPMASYTDANGDGSFTIGEPYVANTPYTQKAYTYSTFSGSAYLGTIDVPFEAWDISSSPARQLNVVIRDRDQDGQWNLHADNRTATNAAALANGGDMRFNYTWIMASDYQATGKYGDGTGGTIDFWSGAGGAVVDGMWVLWMDERGSSRGMLAEECILTLTPNFINTTLDTYSFTATAPASGAAAEKQTVANVGVYPNPYYAFNPAETNRFARFVTFNNLPPKVKIRIFNLAGQLVRTLEKDDASQFLRWDLTNQATFPVASGMYIAHLTMTMPSNNAEVTKVLKLGVIQEQEILDTY